MDKEKKMKLNGKDFYCPNSGVCICAATGLKRPTKECADIAKRLSKRKNND